MRLILESLCLVHRMYRQGLSDGDLGELDL